MTVPAAGDRGCLSVRPATGADRAAVEALLSRSGLPLAGVEQWLPEFLVAEHEGAVVAVAGMELYESSALLRSVAVAPEWRSTGLGRRLVDDLLDRARQREVHDVYLLTTTAEHYFPRLGFCCVERGDVPGCVQDSVEFREACPSSAVAMRKTLAAAR